jgi:cullin 1
VSEEKIHWDLSVSSSFCFVFSGEIIDVEVIFQTMDSIVCIGAINKSKPLELYREQFEAPYLAELREYYRAESLAFIDANGMSEYMKKAETRIAEEEARAKKFLEKSSFDVVRKAVDAVLIEAHKELLQVECARSFFFFFFFVCFVFCFWFG